MENARGASPVFSAALSASQSVLIRLLIWRLFMSLHLLSSVQFDIIFRFQIINVVAVRRGVYPQLSGCLVAHSVKIVLKKLVHVVPDCLDLLTAETLKTDHVSVSVNNPRNVCLLHRFPFLCEGDVLRVPCSLFAACIIRR